LRKRSEASAVALAALVVVVPFKLATRLALLSFWTADIAMIQDS
jgi:hypothetical protein